MQRQDWAYTYLQSWAVLLLMRLVSGTDKTSDNQSGVLSKSSLSLSLSLSFSASLSLSAGFTSPTIGPGALLLGESSLAISRASSSDNRPDPCLINYSLFSQLHLWIESLTMQCNFTYTHLIFFSRMLLQDDVDRRMTRRGKLWKNEK